MKPLRSFSDLEGFLFCGVGGLPPNPIQIISGVDHFIACRWIGFGPSCGSFDFLGKPVFEFKSSELIAFFFYPVDFLLIVGSPEVVIAMNLAVVEILLSLDRQVVFPKISHIRTKIQAIEILDNRISDTVIIEIPSAVFDDFLSQISAVSSYSKYHKYL